MRILHVVEGLGRGGAERRLINDLTHLRGGGFEHRVCALGREQALAHEIAQLDVVVERVGLERLSDWWTALTRLRDILDRFPADLVHSHVFWADCYARIVARERRLPALVTLHATTSEPGTFVYSRKRHLVDWVLARWSGCRYLAVSAQVQRSAIQYLGVGPDRVTLIHTGVDPDRLRSSEAGRLSALRQACGLDGASHVLIMVGRLDPPKGHRILLGALALLRERHPGLRVLFVGTGALDSTLRAQVVRDGLASMVRFLGERDDVKDLLAISDTYVFPTRCEGFPLTLAEAMALGKSCVASRFGPVEELIECDGMSGYLVEEHTSEAWAKAIERVMHDPQRHEVGRRASEVISRQFSAQRQAEALGRLYRSLASEAVQEKTQRSVVFNRMNVPQQLAAAKR